MAEKQAAIVEKAALEADKKAKHQAAIAVQKEKGSKIREEKLRKQQEIVAAKLVRKKEAAKKKAVVDAEDARRKAEAEAEKKKVIAKAEAERERQKQEEKLRRERYAEEKRRKEGLAAEEKARQEKEEATRSAQRATAFQREADGLEIERAAAAAAAAQAQSSPAPASQVLNTTDKVASRRGVGYTATPPVAVAEDWPDLLGGSKSAVATVAAPEPPAPPKPKLSKKERKKAAAAERAAAAKATRAAKAAAASAAVAAAAVVPPSQKQAAATLTPHGSRHDFLDAFPTPSQAAPPSLAVAPAGLLRDAGPVSPIAPPGGGGASTAFQSTSPESFLGSAALGGEPSDTWDPMAADADQPSADVLGGFDQLFSGWDAGEPAFPPDGATPWESQPSPGGDQMLPPGITAAAPLWAQQDSAADAAGARAVGGPPPGIPLLSSGSRDAFGGISHLGTSAGSQPDADRATSLPPRSDSGGVWAPGGGHPGEQGGSASTWGEPLSSQAPADDTSQQWSTPAQAQAEAARLAQSSWLSQQAEATGASRAVSTAAASSSWSSKQAEGTGANRAVSAPWDSQGQRQDQQQWGSGGGNGDAWSTAAAESSLAVDAQAWSGGSVSSGGGGGSAGIGSAALADPMVNSTWGMQPDLGGTNNGQLPWGDQSPTHSPQSSGGQPWAAHGVTEPPHVEASWSTGPAAGFLGGSGGGGGAGGGLGPSGFNPNAPNWNSRDDGSAFVDPNAGWRPAAVLPRETAFKHDANSIGGNAMLSGPSGGQGTPGLGSGVGLGGPPGVGMSPTIGGGSPIVLTINGFQTMDTARSIKAFVAGKVPVRGYNEVPDIGCVLLELTNQGDAELVKGLLHNMDVQGAQLHVAYASPDVVESFKMLMQTQHVPPPDESPTAIFDTFPRTMGAPGIPHAHTPPFPSPPFPMTHHPFNDQISNGGTSGGRGVRGNNYVPRARP